MNNKANQKYRKLKASLILKGTNLKRWAEVNGYAVPTVYQAAAGRRFGVESVRIKKELEVFAYGK